MSRDWNAGGKSARWGFEGMPSGEEAASIQADIRRTMGDVMADDRRASPINPWPSTKPEPKKPGNGWAAERPLAPPPPHPLIGALRDDFGPTNLGRDDWRQARKWLGRWELVSGDDLVRLGRMGVTPSEKELEWLWSVVKDKVAEAEALQERTFG